MSVVYVAGAQPGAGATATAAALATLWRRAGRRVALVKPTALDGGASDARLFDDIDGTSHPTPVQPGELDQAAKAVEAAASQADVVLVEGLPLLDGDGQATQTGELARLTGGTVVGVEPYSSASAGDVAALPYRDGSFDVYYSGGVVEHFEAGCHAALREARRVLRPNGVLLISVPYDSPMRKVLSLFRRIDWKRVRGPRQDPAGAGLRFFQYCYTPAEFTPMLRAAGLRVVKTQGYAILWGLHDVPALQRLVGALAKTRASEAGGHDTPAAPAVAAGPAPPTGTRALVKRLVVAEDDTVPVGGWAVRFGRWFCSNMMMYVCVPAGDEAPATAGGRD